MKKIIIGLVVLSLLIVGCTTPAERCIELCKKSDLTILSYKVENGKDVCKCQEKEVNEELNITAKELFVSNLISFVPTVTLPCNNITLRFIEDNFSISTTAKEVCDMFKPLKRTEEGG